MKKNLTKLLTAGTVLALALSLAACGQSGDTPEDVLNRAQEALQDVSSMHYTIDMEMGFTVEDESIELTTSADADCIMEPMTVGMDMSTSIAGLFDMDMKMYMVQEGDSFLVYTGIDDGEGNVTWTKQTMDDLDALAQYDGQANMELYLENGSNFQAAGTEEVAGVTATRYDGVITGESIEAVMESSGVMDQFAALGLDGLEDLYKDMGDLPVSIWIAEDTCLPVKYEMDMSEMMSNMMAKLMGSSDETEDLAMTVDKCVMVMVCDGYDTVDAIDIPQEALDASDDGSLAEDLLGAEEDEAMEEALADAG